MRYLFLLAIATLALGADARLTARKARQLEENYNYNNGQYYNANANYNNNNNGNNNNGNQNNYQGNGNNQNYMNQYNQDGQYQGNNGNYNNGNYNNYNGQQQQEGQEDQDMEEQGSQDGQYGGYYDQDSNYYNFESKSDAEADAMDDDQIFSIQHYKYLLEVHDMMEAFRLATIILSLVIVIMSCVICFLRRQLRIAREEPNLSALISNQPYHLAGAKKTVA